MPEENLSEFRKQRELSNKMEKSDANNESMASTEYQENFSEPVKLLLFAKHILAWFIFECLFVCVCVSLRVIL